MGLLELWFESGEDSLSVRRFAVHEAMSSLFSVNVWARSTNDDIDTEAIVGKHVGLTAQWQTSLARPTGKRHWSGVCQHLEQVQTEATGLSTYYLRIVPTLWLLTQRTNHRVVQRLSAQEIVSKLLDEWGIEPEWRVQKTQHPKLHLRTQYGESDYAFMSRILEEAGISFFFRDDEKKGSVLVLSDAPQADEAREGGPIDYTDAPGRAHESNLQKLLDPVFAQGQEYVTQLRFAQQIRPGKVTLRDHDFRRKPDFKLAGQSPSTGKASIEDRLEVYHYAPGAFLVELEDTVAKDLDAAVGAKVGHGHGHGLTGAMAGAIHTAKKAEATVADAAGDAASKGKESFGEKAAHAAAGAAGSFAAGAIMGAVFPDKPKDGEKKGWVQKLEDKAIQAGAGYLDKKVTDLVGGKVSGALAGPLGKLAGGLVGDFAGHLAGDLAGKMASKLASMIAAPLHHPSPKLAGDDRGAARFDEKHGQTLAAKKLQALRGDRFAIDFSTNCIDLSPGTVLSIQGHGRKNLGPDRRLLVTEFMVEGTQDGEWHMSCHAVFADTPYHPPMKTPKPTIQGHQSAVVVGPPGEEIHTDEFGRVRVQFHWDREGKHDHNSHCWVRVAQGSAGAGFGMIQLPRVGQEVLVGFLEGDPDHPVVMGSVFSNTTPVTHGLPGHKSRSSWKSNTYPGGGGSNEIMLEDAKGRELLYLLAHKNMQQIVNNDRGTIVGSIDSTIVGDKYEVKVALPAGAPPDDQTEVVMVNKRIELTTGDAKIILEKDTITLWAKKGIKVLSEGDHIEVETKKGDVKIQGGPDVKINCPPEKKKKDEKKKGGGAGAETQPAAETKPAAESAAGAETNPAAETPKDASSGPPGVPKMPPGVSLDANVAEAKAHYLNASWFKNKVRNNKEGRPDSWDYKQLGQEYQDFGNFNYGLTGSALGIPKDILLKQAGKAQQAAKTSKPEWGDPGWGGVLGGTPPYGDDPDDQAMITKGVDYYDEHYKNKK
jgi:uncharacterized protein involved in type VI secretion and phage assembly